MRNLAKVIVISVFALGGIFVFLCGSDNSRLGFAQAVATPTPKANTNAATNTNTAAPANANAKPAATATPAVAAGGKTIREQFILGADSRDEKYGKVPFNHRTHAELKYNPEGTGVVGCVECHHTDQPKSALKPPLATSERDVILTMDVWRTSSQKVSECRACHFQDGDVPEGKEMPTAQYTERGKTVTKDLNNENAYHINCNTCHDAAAKARPSLKGKPGFATGQDCATCHSGGN